MGHLPFRLEDWTPHLTDYDKAQAAQRGRSTLPSGDYFAWSYWRIVTQHGVTVSWDDFLEWDLWQIGATLGLDRAEASEEDMEALARYEEAANRPPSTERKG